MKKILAIFSVILGAVLVFSGCTKVEDLKYYDKGTPVNLTASKTTVALTRADSTNPVVSFAWTDPKYGTDTSNYKFVVEIDSAGRQFSKSVKREVIGRRSTAFTGRELNAILLGFGFALDKAHTLDVRVTSSYANNNEQYKSNVVTMTVTPFADPSKLETTATSVTGTLTTGTQKALTFNWTPSFPGYSGKVTYTLQYDSTGKNFANLDELALGDDLYTRDMTKAEINESALASGIAGGTTGKVDYRIKAVTAQGAVAYSNTVSVTVNTYVPVIRLYLPGGYQAATGQGNNWSPETAPEMIRDMRSNVLNKLYYTYMYLPAGAEFKITAGRSWDVNYGGSGGNLSAGGANLTVPAAGVYRISVDLANMKYDIREGRMGVVGGATGAGWNPPNVFPNYALGYAAPNLFVGVFDFTADGWKMIDNNEWNGGANANTVLETRSYGSSGPSGSTMVVNGDNFPNITTPGRYRVIWDGRDPDNIKYFISPATEMRVVGDGLEGVADWNPGASPQMTYSGNGVWTITLALKANKDFKFVAGDKWDVFDYEDAGNGRIKWEGGSNFKTPATAGTYTITLNEKTQTYTIN